jgi:hypothetical protein
MEGDRYWLGRNRVPSQFRFVTKSKHAVLFRGMDVMILAHPSAFGQPAVPRTLTPGVAAPAARAITILASATGASYEARQRATLGRVSLFRTIFRSGRDQPEELQVFVISTRVALKINCPAS